MKVIKKIKIKKCRKPKKKKNSSLAVKNFFPTSISLGNMVNYDPKLRSTQAHIKRIPRL